MQRYTSDDKPSMYKDDDGGYYKVEDVDPIIADRDIKAANLQKLVDKVLALEDAVNRAVESGGDGDVFEAEELNRQLLDLARGLKQ